MRCKIETLKRRIEEMRSKCIRDEETGKTMTIGEIALKSKSQLAADDVVSALIGTTLAMRQRWQESARPRLKAFNRNYPSIKTLEDLGVLMESMSEHDFCQEVLHMHTRNAGFWRYRMLKGMMSALIQYRRDKGLITDWETLVDWAEQVRVDDVKQDIIGKIAGVNVATVQNLRLSCGVDTAKPDLHVKNALRKMGLGNEVQVIELLSDLTGYSCTELDQIFWYWDKNQ